MSEYHYIVVGCVVQSAVDSRVTSPVGGVVAALPGLPVVIVSAGSFVHLSSSSLPVVNIPLTSAVKQSCDTVTVQSCKDYCTSVLQNSALSTGAAVVPDLPGLIRSVAGASGVSSGVKPVPRLSRLNAVDLPVTNAADSDVSVLSVTTASPAVIQPMLSLTISPQTINSAAADNESSESSDAERLIPRREIAPIPGAVCSQEAARVGSSYLCSFCGKAFSSAPQLAVHRNIHFFERQFKCTVCRSSFASRAALEQHRVKEQHGETESVSNADPRPYKCEECGIAFRIQGHLAKHKRSKAHAARLENSQDLPGSADAEDSCSALPLTIDERDTVETELDECQHEVICQDSAAITEQEHSNIGEIRCLLSLSAHMYHVGIVRVPTKRKIDKCVTEIIIDYIGACT